jgi:hypothetical protein
MVMHQIAAIPVSTGFRRTHANPAQSQYKTPVANATKTLKYTPTAGFHGYIMPM